MDFTDPNLKVHFFQILKNVLKFMHHKNRWLIPVTALATVAAVIMNYFPVIFQKTLIGKILAPESFSTSLLVIVITYFITMLLSSTIFELSNGYCKSRFSLTRLDFMAAIHNKYLQMDYKYIEDATFADSIEPALMATQSNDSGFELFMHMIFKLPAVFISIVLMAFLIATKVPIILLGLLVNIFVVFWVKNSAKKLRFKKKEEEMSARRKVNYYSTKTSDFNFGKDIRIFSLQRMLKNGYQREIETLTELFTLFQNREFFLGIFSVITLTLSDALILGSLIIKAKNGLPIAEFSMLLTAATSLSLLIKATVEEIAALVGEARYVQSAYNFLSMDLANQQGMIKTPLIETLEIEFKNVTFRYPNTEKDIFKNLSFTIKKGEKIAIVGINGAGKTTLAKLITGLFSPTEGEILINGHTQESFTRDALQKMFAAVFQEITIMPFDVTTNIAIKKEKIDERRIWEALEKVGLKEKMESLPNKLQQKLNKSVYDDAINLSGGEAQKLAIARALYKNANMIILDEPTAALDALAEQDIYENFNQLIDHKTAIYISHRLASTKFCDNILLLDGNGIAEAGSHDELMALRGKYFEMFKVQGKYYNQEPSHEEI